MEEAREVGPVTEPAEADDDMIVLDPGDLPGDDADDTDADPLSEDEEGTEETDDAPASGDADAPGAETAEQGTEGREEKTGPDHKALYEGLVARQTEDREAAKYRSVYQEQFALTGNDALSRMVAASECGGRSYPLEDAPQDHGEADPLRAGIQSVLAAYPDAAEKEMPRQVMDAVAGGTPMLDAYRDYRSKEDQRTIAELRAENERLRQQADSRRRAPVRGVSGSGKTQGSKDPFTEGFDSDTW